MLHIVLGWIASCLYQVGGGIVRNFVALGKNRLITTGIIFILINKVCHNSHFRAGGRDHGSGRIKN